MRLDYEVNVSDVMIFKLTLRYDNFKVMDMIRKICGIDWEPTWECLNHQIVQSVASLTGIRFNQKGSHAISGAELTGNLVTQTYRDEPCGPKGPFSAMVDFHSDLLNIPV